MLQSHETNQSCTVLKNQTLLGKKKRDAYYGNPNFQSVTLINEEAGVSRVHRASITLNVICTYIFENI